MSTHPGQSSSIEKKMLLRSGFWPLMFVLVILLVKMLEEMLGSGFSGYGLKPKSVDGLLGIATYPFLHKDFGHLFSNAIPLLFLGTALFYYYKKASSMIFLQLFLISGIWLWLLAKAGSVHIGASGLVYGLAAFHVTAGLIKRNHRLMAFALLVLFLYGSLVWGIFPDFFPKRNISWEGHLTGMAAGVLLAWFHRKQGPEKDTYSWEEEDEVEDENEVEVENEIEGRDDQLKTTSNVTNWNSTGSHNKYRYRYESSEPKNRGLQDRK